MILGLFAFLVGISLTLIVFGFINRLQSGYALIGFSLFFILSMIIQNGNLEVEKGADILTNYSYVGTQIVSTTEEVVYDYTEWNDDVSHQIGFWLAVISAVGFFFILYSIRKGRKEVYE